MKRRTNFITPPLPIKSLGSTATPTTTWFYHNRNQHLIREYDARWRRYRNYAATAFTTALFCYAGANATSDSAFNLSFAQACYEAKMGTRFQFDDFKSWEDLIDTFCESYTSCLSVSGAPEKHIHQEKENAKYALYALKTKDHQIFLNFVESLKQRKIFENHSSIFNQLMDICTRLSKVDVLRELNTIYPGLTRLNKKARKLLTDPNAGEIQRLTEQFITGPGSMKDDGADIFIHALYEMELNDAHSDYLKSQLVNYNQSNSEDWVESFLSHFKKQQAIHERYDQDHLAIISEFLDDHSPDEQFLLFAENLKNKLLNSRPTLQEGTFLIAGSHFTCGKLRLEKDTNNEITAKLICIDGKGANWGQLNFRYHFLLHDFFNGKIETFISEEFIQKAGKGCSFIATQQLYYLLHLSRYIPNGDLFDYIRNQPPGNEATLVQPEIDALAIKTIIHAKTTRLPAALCIFRQAIDDRHKHDSNHLARYHRDQLVIGNDYLSAIDSSTSSKVHAGCYGVLTDLQERAEEYDAPSSPRTKDGSTLRDLLIKNYLVQQSNGKPANLGTDHFSFYAGTSIVSRALQNGLLNELPSPLPRSNFFGEPKAIKQRSYNLSSSKKPTNTLQKQQ